MFLLISVDQIELDSFLLVPNFYNIWWISHGVLEISQQAADFKGGLRTNGGFEQLAENFFRGEEMNGFFSEITSYMRP